MTTPKYATKWEPITQEEFHEIYKRKLNVYSGYTNPDGDDGLSSQPQLYITWGNDEKELIKCIATGERDRNKEDWPWTPWEYKHWKAIEWETEE